MLLCYLLSAVPLTLMLLIEKFLQPRFFSWQTHHQWKMILYALKSLSKNIDNSVISYSVSSMQSHESYKILSISRLTSQ